MRLPAWMPPGAACHPGCRWLDLAVGLVGLGYAPIPVGSNKVPLVKWADYALDPPTWRVLYNDWRPAWAQASGVGLICGRPHGLVVVDFDDENHWTWAVANLPVVRGVKTRRGGHLHFRHPPRGIIGNRSGSRAVVLASDVRCDVKGLVGMAVGPYSRHPSGHIYEPLGDWTCRVAELPPLPECIVGPATDHPPRPAPPPLRRRGGDPSRALGCYIDKCGGIPPEGSGSDEAVFRGAVWAKANVPRLGPAEFVATIRRYRPGFTDAWVLSKWHSARRA
jgi:hypothetical protein